MSYTDDLITLYFSLVAILPILKAFGVSVKASRTLSTDIVYQDPTKRRNTSETMTPRGLSVHPVKLYSTADSPCNALYERVYSTVTVTLVQLRSNVSKVSKVKDL